MAGSHPVWVRGLKLTDAADLFQSWKSHPVWVRGLKLEVTLSNNSDYKVAPRVGAWIETVDALSRHADKQSHPVWVRGLKHRLYEIVV